MSSRSAGSWFGPRLLSQQFKSFSTDTEFSAVIGPPCAGQRCEKSRLPIIHESAFFTLLPICWKVRQVCWKLKVVLRKVNGLAILLNKKVGNCPTKRSMRRRHFCKTTIKLAMRGGIRGRNSYRGKVRPYTQNVYRNWDANSLHLTNHLPIIMEV